MARLAAPPAHPHFQTAPWPRGDPLVRVHAVRFGPCAFNPGYGQSRFHPVRDAEGKTVPTLYAGADFETALLEVPLRDMPRGAVIFASILAGYVRSVLVPKRALTLIDLYTGGLKRLGVSAKALVHSPPSGYPKTVRWAAALHAASRADGMIWRSRQMPTHDAMVLWGGRVRSSDFDVVDGPSPLTHGTLYARMLTLAADHGIVISPDN